ncbi:hypothetical protein ACVDFE_01190 [Lentzea chajnantorensis]
MTHPLAGPTRRLALPASAQRAHLESIGTAPSTDELALEFDDVRRHPVPPAAGPFVDRIDTLLETMSGPGPVWHVTSLPTAAQWAELRLLAAELLRHLPAHPRPLAPSERELLALLLTDFPGLHAQLDHVQVRAPWYDGSASLDLDTSGPAADVPDGVLPVSAEVHSNGEHIGELLLWVANGRLSAIEYAWVTDEPPHTLPPAAAVTTRR